MGDSAVRASCPGASKNELKKISKPISHGKSLPVKIRTGIAPKSKSWITSHESIVLERPSLSIIGAPNREEKIFGSSAQNPTTPVHKILPVDDKTYHGSKICINSLVNDEKASVVNINLSGVLFALLVSNSILNI